MSILIPIIGISMILGVLFLMLIYPIMALVHCIKNEDIEQKSKIIWIVSMVLTWPFGSFFYGFLKSQKASFQWISILGLIFSMIVVYVKFFNPSVIESKKPASSVAVSSFENKEILKSDIQKISKPEYYEEKYSNGILKLRVLSSDGSSEMKNGDYNMYYPSGKLQEEGMYANNHKQGPYKIYDSEEKLQEEGIYSRDSKSGPYKIYYPNEKLKEEGSYNSGYKQGLTKYYRKDGSLEMEVSLQLGIKQGPYKVYSTDGKVYEEGTYSNDSKNGRYKVYYPNGVVKLECEYAIGVKYGPYKLYDINGKLKEEGSIINGERRVTNSYAEEAVKL